MHRERKGDEKGTKKESRKKWFHPDLNRGPSLRQSDVITNYTMKPLNTRALKRNIISRRVKGEKEKKTRQGVYKKKKKGE
mgnify:CR=1 FL=1